MYFYSLLKIVLVIFLIARYFYDKNLKNAILDNFSVLYIYLF